VIRADLSRHKSARARAEAEKLRSKEEAETEAVQVRTMGEQWPRQRPFRYMRTYFGGGGCL
jgi:hypothetical protein